MCVCIDVVCSTVGIQGCVGGGEATNELTNRGPGDLRRYLAPRLFYHFDIISVYSKINIFLVNIMQRRVRFFWPATTTLASNTFDLNILAMHEINRMLIADNSKYSKLTSLPASLEHLPSIQYGSFRAPSRNKPYTRLWFIKNTILVLDKVHPQDKLGVAV